MKKSLAIFGAAMAMAMTAMPSSASAAVTVTCTTSTGSTNPNGIGGGSSSCDTLGGGNVNASNWRRSSTAPIGSGTEFWFRTVTSGGSNTNPLASIDISNNRINIQVLGIRTLSSTILTFTSSQPFTGFSNATGIFARAGVLSLSGNTLRVNLSNVPLGSTPALSAGSFDFTPAVPEPGTWLLMILGLGAVGFAMRRRQAATVRYQFA